MRLLSTARLLARAVVLAVVSTLAISLFFSGPAGAATDLEKRMIRMINRERVERGIDRLATRDWLVKNARRHSRAMGESGTYFHNDRLASQLQEYRWQVVGENVGRSFDVPSMHEWFMQSPGHKGNILEEDFNRIGVGIVRKNGSLWFTQVFAG